MCVCVCMSFCLCIYACLFVCLSSPFLRVSPSLPVSPSLYHHFFSVPPPSSPVSPYLSIFTRLSMHSHSQAEAEGKRGEEEVKKGQETREDVGLVSLSVSPKTASADRCQPLYLCHDVFVCLKLVFVYIWFVCWFIPLSICLSVWLSVCVFSRLFVCWLVGVGVWYCLLFYLFVINHLRGWYLSCLYFCINECMIFFCHF